MTIELTAIPLSFLAGMLSILSPCIWPLVPVVMSSAATSGRTGPLWLALGLSLSFAVAGTLLTFLFINLNMNPDALRGVAAGLLLLVGLTLVVPAMGNLMARGLTFLTSPFGNLTQVSASTPFGQFGVGALLGLVWLPCVGPTLGAAIALASMGQEMHMAFLVMLSFGVGTAGLLVIAGYASGQLLAKLRPGMMGNAAFGKKLLGWLLLFMAVLVMTGLDKRLEAFALRILPDWAIMI